MQGREINYRSARLRNWHTGQLQEILLVDWNELERALGTSTSRMNAWHELFREPATTVEPPPELKKDVRDVLRLFSPIEQRILFRVIVQGQSFEVATARMKASATSWRRWYQDEAAPLMRAKLGDYKDTFRFREEQKEVA